MDRNTYLIAAAGTGGHILPGIAVADKIKENEPDSRVLFCGTKTGMENTLVKNAGYKLLQIKSSGLSGRFTIRNIVALFNFTVGFFQCLRILRKLKVSAVLGMGGYITGPVVIACKFLGVPVILHEQNAFPGKANLWLSKYSETVCISYPDTLKYFSRAKKVVVTGNPVRSVFFGIKKDESRKKLGIDPDEKIVFITGGSLGAKSINDAVTKMVKTREINNFRIILASGKRDYDNVANNLKDYKNIIEVKDYIFNQHLYMSAADLLVCRAGAITCSEAAILGRACIMVPYPFAAGDHQSKNAGAFTEIGAAKVISDKNLTTDLLFSTISDLISDEENLKKMGDTAFSLAYPNAAELIYKQINKASGDSRK